MLVGFVEVAAISRKLTVANIGADSPPPAIKLVRVPLMSKFDDPTPFWQTNEGCELPFKLPVKLIKLMAEPTKCPPKPRCRRQMSQTAQKHLVITSLIT